MKRTSSIPRLPLTALVIFAALCLAWLGTRPLNLAEAIVLTRSTILVSDLLLRGGTGKAAVLVCRNVREPAHCLCLAPSQVNIELVARVPAALTEIEVLYDLLNRLPSQLVGGAPTALGGVATHQRCHSTGR